MLKSYLLSNEQEYLFCQYCDEYLKVIDVVSTGNALEGNASCPACQITSMKFQINIGSMTVFISDLNNSQEDMSYYLSHEKVERAKVWLIKSTEKRKLTTEKRKLTTKRKLFVVVQKSSDTFRIMKIYTRHSAAIDLCRTNDSLQILNYSCLQVRQEYFKVHVISVGEGKSYRIVKIEIDKKKAIKIAISINGLISTHQVGPNNILPQSVEYYKFVINLDLEADHIGRIYFFGYCYKERFLELEKPGNPFITHRRAYDEELPNRLEIYDINRDQAKEIAQQFSTLSMKEVIERFEYNVDYNLKKVLGRWIIDGGEIT